MNKNLLRSFVVFMVALSVSNVLLGKEPDTDLDGVSNFDDYCPRTPAGRPVWKPADVTSGKAQLNWVGCIGGTIEVAARGFKPPTRPVPLDSATRAGNVEKWFNEAAGEKVLEFADLQGWHAGRCYSPASPDRTLGGLMWSYTDDSDGPAFDPRRILWGNVSAFVTYFDKMSAQDEADTLAYIRGIIPTMKENLTEVDSALCTSQAKLSIYIRQKAGILYQKVTSDPGCTGSDGVPLNYCYFFKKVRE